MTYRPALLALLLAGSALASPADAAGIVALTGDNTLAWIDADAGTVKSTVRVNGIAGRLLGIDLRPADGKLYGVFADGSIATIDARSGAASKVSTLSTQLPAGVVATVDFNPAADRLRVIGSDGTNLRVNVDDGKVVTDGRLAYAATDMHKGETPNIVAGAYTNSVAGAKSTTLYDIDATIGGLIRQAPPNDGVLNAIGKLGLTLQVAGFDIVTDAQGGNAAWLMVGDTLYAVDLESGAAKGARKIAGLAGPARDLAILP